MRRQIIAARDDREQQLDILEDMMVRGVPHAAVIQNLSHELGVDVSEDQLALLKKGVRARWQTDHDAARDSAKAACGAKLKHAQYVTLVSGDMKAYLKAIELEMDLHGLRTQVRKHEGVVGLTPVQALTPEQRRAEIDRLIEKRARAQADQETQH